MGRPRKFSREGVLQKALPVFWKYGFARTTLPELEQATGVNKSGLYAEFESKDALFLACLRHYLDTRNGGALLMAEPLGWGNIERFLEEAPSCAIDLPSEPMKMWPIWSAGQPGRSRASADRCRAGMDARRGC